MNQIEEIATGLLILSKYNDHVCAEHDTIYGCPPHETISEEDTQLLKDGGWDLNGQDGWTYVC